MTDLADLTAALRAELATELPVRLHASTFPASEDEASYGMQLGLPFTVTFERYLSHPDWWGGSFLAASSILEIGDMCRSRHPDHRSPGLSTATCERIVSGMVEFGRPIGQIAWSESLDPVEVERLALAALQHAQVWRHQQLHRMMRSARTSEREGGTVITCGECRGQVVSQSKGRPAA